MPWLVLSVLPNLDLRFDVAAHQAAIAPAADHRVAELRAAHPNLDQFMSRFRNAHGRPVAPAAMLLDAEAPDCRRTGETMVGLRNALAVSAVTRQTALELLRPRGHRILFSDPFDFYPWSLDRDFDRMISITPASMALHRVDDFAGQPSPGSPVHTLDRSDVDHVLLSEILAHWDAAYGRTRPSKFDVALFRSLNMANAAMRMPATTGATIFDYGRQCGLWISAFEILAHHDAGRGRADLPAVFALLDRKRFHMRALNARRSRATFRGRTTQVPLPHRLYERLYRVRNDFLHGNPVTSRSLRIPGSGRFIGHFAPLLYRAALRNFLDLRYVADVPAADARVRLEARFAEHRYEEAQVDVEQGLLLSRTAPLDDDG